MSFMCMTVAAFVLSASPAEMDAEVAEAFRIIAADPPIADIQRAALDHYAVSPSDFTAMRTAARLKALLPTLSGNFSQNDGKTLGVGWDANVGYAPGGLPQTNNNSNNTGRTYGASATWTLGSLVFDSQQIDTYGLVGIHDSVLTGVTRLYFTRQHNILALAVDPPKDPRTKAALMLRTREIESMLDAMTGGAWSRLRKGEK